MSNREPNPESGEKPSESRLLRVEERIAWLERHVIEQDRAMLEMTETMERLKQELLALRAAGSGAGEREANANDEAADERPPHY